MTKGHFFYLKILIGLATHLLIAGESKGQAATAKVAQVKVGSFVQRKFMLEDDLRHDFRLISPKIEPAGSCFVDLRVNSQKPNEVVLSVVPRRTGKMRVYGFGVISQTQQKKYLPPVLIEAKSWPMEPSLKVIRGGTGELNVRIDADQTQVKAGEILRFQMIAEGPAAMAIDAEPVIQLRPTDDHATDLIKLKPLRRVESWESRSRHWIYEWTPRLADEYQTDSVVFTYLSTDQHLKSIITNRPYIRVDHRPLFETTEPPLSRNSVKPDFLNYQTILASIGAGTVLLLAFRRMLIRAWIRYWLFVASRPETSFEKSLKIYRRLFRYINLRVKKPSRADSDLLGQVEEKLLGRRPIR